MTLDLIKQLVGQVISFKVDNASFKGELTSCDEDKIYVIISGLSRDFFISQVQIKEDQTRSRQSSSNKSQFTDKQIAAKVNTQKDNNGGKNIQCFDLDQYEDVKLNFQIPKGYDQFKENEKLTGKKSDYTFDKYTIKLNGGSNKQEKSQASKLADARKTPAKKEDVITIEAPQSAQQMKEAFKKQIDVQPQKAVEVQEQAEFKAVFKFTKEQEELETELKIDKKVMVNVNKLPVQPIEQKIQPIVVKPVEEGVAFKVVKEQKENKPKFSLQ